MKRKSPEVESLELEISALRRAAALRRSPPGDLPVTGCGDASCEIASPTGMATNGGCRCDPREVRWALRWYKRRAAFLEETIRTMRGEGV